MMVCSCSHGINNRRLSLSWAALDMVPSFVHCHMSSWWKRIWFLQWLLAGAWNFASLSSLCIVCEWGRAKNTCQNLIDSDVVQKWERRKTDRCAWKIRCTRPSDEDLECFVFSRTLSKGTTEISLGSHFYYATKRFISDAYVDQSHYLISIWEMNCLWEFSDIHFHR